MVVVSAAHGAFGPLLGKLTVLLAKECGRLKGVRREIRSLRSELASMHAALKEYTKLEDPNEQVRTWISLVRELAYDTEDVFDKFIHQLGNGQDHGGFKEFFRKTTRRLKTLGCRRRIAEQIDELKDRIKQVKELKDSYKLNDDPPGNTCHAAVDPRLHALFTEEAHLVGIEGPRDDLSNWMLQEDYSSFKDRKVLSIVGFGGLGKTTLANEVYRNISGHFDTQAFVSVSQKPDIRKIIKDIISQVSCHGVSTKDTIDWDESKSISKLRELLLHKRYLILIDDIWSTQAWKAIKCAFPENNCSSRIIATTRIVDVAKSCCPGADDRMYELGALSDLHSQILFHKRIFGSQDSCPDILAEVSNEILKKCGGLPLAIISISSLLANRSATKQEWEKVKRSIGSALENNQSLEGMNSILCLSYNDLPPYLKTCLLYLSVFPEDYEIDRERLVRRWIAEGFISEERGQSQQEVAENYFYELINKSMVQPVYIGYDGKARACRVHDMMLEIIISKSAEDNFITVVGGGQPNLANLQGFIRRLLIRHIDQELAFALANEDLSHVRSLTVMPSCCIEHLPSLVQFEALRVLDLEGCDLDDSYTNSMDKLYQLRYLNLRHTRVSKLPSRIEVLRNLETLIIWNTQVRDLPAGIVELAKLRHLIGVEDVPNGTGVMRKLQLMSGFNIYSSSKDALEDLGNFTSLEELQVFVVMRAYSCKVPPPELRRLEEAFLSSLCKLGTSKLRDLNINAKGVSLEFLDSWSPPPSSLEKFTAAMMDSFTSFPKWITPALTNLVDLHITLVELTEDDLLTLGKLSSLLRLALELSKKFIRVRVQGMSFPSLKAFDLGSIHGSYVTFLKGSMPKLENLKIEYSASMAKTDGFSLGIENLPCLKQARIWLKWYGTTTSEAKAAAAVIRSEAGAHPNHVVLTFLGEPTEETGGSDSDNSSEADDRTDEN